MAGQGTGVPVQVLNWEPVVSAVEYLVEIAQDAQFSHVIERQRLSRPPYRWNPPSAQQTYYFRVCGFDAEGRAGAFSEPLPIEPLLQPPTLMSPADGTTLALVGTKSAVTLRWAAARAAAGYVVQLSTDRTFETPARYELRTDRAELTWEPPQPGAYAWRVGAIDRAGRQSGWSSAFVVRFRPPSVAVPLPLPAPVLQSPVGAAKLMLLAPGEPRVALLWQEQPSAAGYEVEVATSGNFTSLLFHDKTCCGRAEIPVPGPGHFFWHVRSLAQNNSPGAWSETAQFAAAPKAARIELRASSLSRRPNRVVRATITAQVLGETGQGVEQIVLRGSASKGSLSAFAALADGVYTADWTGSVEEARSGASVSVAGPFGLSASEPVELRLPPAALWVGAKVGLAHNLGALVGPRGEIQFLRELSDLDVNLRASLSAGYVYASHRSTHGVRSRTTLHRFPVGLAAVYSHSTASVTPYLLAGLVFEPYRAELRLPKLTPQRQQGVLAGLIAGAGATRGLGAGALFAEVTYSYQPPVTELFAMGGHGLVISLGYRIRVR